MRKINLGCGNRPLDGYENYDKFPRNDKIKFIDLDSLPLPFEDNSIDEVLLYHVLEHLSIGPLEFMGEITRIIKVDGILYVRLPIWSNRLQHIRFFHSKNYLSELTQGAGKNTEYFKAGFEQVYVKGDNHYSLIVLFSRIIAMLRDMGYSQYEWKFIKK